MSVRAKVEMAQRKGITDQTYYVCDMLARGSR